MTMISKLKLDERKTFHSPNNGRSFSSISLPRELLRVIKELDGQTLILREAIHKIKCAIINIEKYKVRINKECIVLRSDSDYDFHFWCIIKFEPPL